MTHYPDEIKYSEEYQDPEYEYRHVILPKVMAKKMLRLYNGPRLLEEREWRCIGVQQSRRWVHYEIHRPEPHILLFRRPRAVVAVASAVQEAMPKVPELPLELSDDDNDTTHSLQYSIDDPEVLQHVDDSSGPSERARGLLQGLQGLARRTAHRQLAQLQAQRPELWSALTAALTPYSGRQYCLATVFSGFEFPVAAGRKENKIKFKGLCAPSSPLATF